MPIVWKMPDGTVRIATFTEEFLEKNRLPGEDTATAVMRLAPHFQVKDPSLLPATAILVKSEDIPKDRTTRDKWSIKAGKLDDGKGTK